MVLRNPLLAEKAGLIYRASMNVTAGVFNEGGWLYCSFDDASDYKTLPVSLFKMYAARIPALKDVGKRRLFSPIQFPLLDDAATSAAFDEIMREAIVYDDGFAKIVHSNQPVNHHLLKENDNSNPPVKDFGIRLGWDDEQMLIWNNRQMRQKEETTGETVDAPLGVFGYRIDARLDGTVDWFSQNNVVATNGITIQQGNIKIAEPGTDLEPPVEIYPAAHGNSKLDGFWLPLYFTNWMGKPLSIPDKDAEEINKINPTDIRTDVEQKETPVDPNAQKNTINTVPKQTFHPYKQVEEDILPLTYGKTYQFRVRFMDITGGGPTKGDDRIHGAQNPESTTHFKRHVEAGPMKVLNVQQVLNANPITDEAGFIAGVKPLPDLSVLENIVDEDAPRLLFNRPLLQYPAVVFTGKYVDAVTRLKNILDVLPNKTNIKDREAVVIGLPDPDVKSFLVRVEVKSLEMDNAKSKTGKEPYIPLYEKTYNMSENEEETFVLKIVYKEFLKIDLEGGFNGSGLAGDELLIPTARHMRLIIEPIVTDADDIYAAKNIEYGKPVIIKSYKASATETDLLDAIDDGVKAIYLQPESEGHHKPAEVNKAKQVVVSSTPVEVERLADTLNLSGHNLTLEGYKGERVQFGCSKEMRHSLAPDSTSVTFSSLGELFNHWIVAVDYNLNRDWTWDGLAVESVTILRSIKNVSDGAFGPEEVAGTIRVSNTASLNSLIEAKRDRSRLLFLDAVDPKKANGSFPDELEVKYRVFAKFKDGFGVSQFGPMEQTVNLPVTIVPHQVPKLISAGIALSGYIPGEKYASTNVRQKFLWLEMEKPIDDPNDAYFIRVLANAPDPLLCLVDESIALNVSKDPPLNISAEKMRTIIPGMQNDFAGLGAMQELIPDEATPSRYFMVPLPPGLHASSDEMFGFFSYEIRVGHSKSVWSTAQGRYGRPLKVNGVQHPAPTLICTATRRKYRDVSLKIFNEIVVTAPYANAVLNGRSVTANPPQTTLWFLLYAQVKQADGITNRNLLIHSAQLYYRPNKKLGNRADEGNRFGTAILHQELVSTKLRSLSLPVSTSLSVLCVEMFPLNNLWRLPTDHGNDFNPNMVEEFNLTVNDFNNTTAPVSTHNNDVRNNDDIVTRATTQDVVNPLIEGLGRFRIYRTSPLVPVGEICCEDC
jgi:hypothetical protein